MEKKPDIAIFYSLAITNEIIKARIKNPAWGRFILPDTRLEQDEYLTPSSKHTTARRAVDFTSVLNQDPQFDKALSKIMHQRAMMICDNRSSAKYYFDCFNRVRQQQGAIQRIVEVGPHLGDLSSILAALLDPMNVTLDLVDIDILSLQYTYEQIRRTFPEAIGKVRLYFGDLPSYVKNVMSVSLEMHLIHYQGSLNFNDVIRDIGATYFCKNKIHSLMMHNTHLRSLDISHYQFTDAALYALFGLNIRFDKLGEVSSHATEPDYSTKPAMYLQQSRVDGLCIPYQSNTFRYPHFTAKLDDFVYATE